MDASSWFVLPPGVETRWASPENPDARKGGGGRTNAGRKGSPCCRLEPGDRLVLAEQTSGSGMIRRIWCTLSDRSPEMLQALRLDFYWDGADIPAVSAPLGDFFGIALGRTAAFQSVFFSSPEGRSFNCCIPMPYRNGMKMTVTHRGNRPLDMFFYDIDYTIGDPHEDNCLYFHAHYGREERTKLRVDYEILPKVEGKGRFLGANIGVRADTGQYFRSWWGEGEFKMYIDGDEEYPTLCGTGAEDYIGTGWSLGAYSHWYQGCPVADHERFEYCFYRYHVPDPVYFYQDVRVTAQQIGGCSPEQKEQFRSAGALVQVAGLEGVSFDYDDPVKMRQWENFERSDDWSSCAYFYLDRPEGLGL